MSYINLNTKTNYSLLGSTIEIDALIEYATVRKLSVLSVVEDGSMHSGVKFFMACREAGIRPIFGVSLKVCANDAKSVWTLFARNQTGYRVLLKLTSDYALDGIVNAEAVLVHARNLVICFDMNSDIASVTKTIDAEMMSGCFVGITSVQMVEQAKFLAHLNLPFVFLPEVRVISADDVDLLQVVTAIKENVKVSEVPAFGNVHFLSNREARVLAESDEFLAVAMANTVTIANLCDVQLDLGRNLLPKFLVPTGDTSADYLEALCVKGMRRRYGDAISGVHTGRLKYELDVISRMGFADYFLIVWDFVKFAKSNGILVGPGRGSAAGSLVSYVLGITGVDPIGYELLFERFLNPERISLPDIDIDFQDDRRDEVIDYVREKYGIYAVCQIATFGTLRGRSSWRDTARTHGLETAQINAVTKFLDSRSSLADNLRDNPALQAYLESHPSHKAIFKKALRLKGFPRNISTHAAGVIISPNDLRNFTALVKGGGTTYLAQYEAEDLEKIGLLKMDFLGLRNLTMIQEISALIRAEVDPDFDIGRIPLDDIRTYQLISAANTMGIFQLESSGMQATLRQLQPNNIEDILSALALYRPGPMANIPMFCARRHGRERINYDHPSLEPILRKTYGIIVYQEQIMQIASLVAGYSLGEADILRRAVSKMKREVLQDEGPKFIAQSEQRGYSQAVAKKIFDLILRFANYGFNRSHAASYAIISYQMAYLKANYPQYFMVSVLRTEMGSARGTVAAIKEARALGIEILPPSVVSSMRSHLAMAGKIRLGLGLIKSIGSEIANKLLLERQKGDFKDFYDFVARTSEFFGEKIMTSLIDAGACDDFGYSRASLHKNVKRVLEHRQYGPIAGTEFVMELADVDPDTNTLMEQEYELYGFYLQTHPIHLFDEQIKQHGWLTPSEIEPDGRGRVTCIGYVTRIKEIKDKNGRPMAFIELTDEVAQVDMTIFAREFNEEYRNLINKVIVINGVVNVRNDRLGINSDRLVTVFD